MTIFYWTCLVVWVISTVSRAILRSKLLNISEVRTAYYEDITPLRRFGHLRSNLSNFSPKVISMLTLEKYSEVAQYVCEFSFIIVSVLYVSLKK